MKSVKNKQILVGADFAGFPLKEAIVAHLKKKGWEVTDVGVRSESDNDPELMFHRIGLRVGSMITEKEFDRALLFCGTGIGISLCANKVHGIRAVVCSDCFSAEMCRKHNNANILSLGGRVVGAGLAQKIVEIFLNTEFEGGRHERRVNMMMDIENK